MAFVVTEQAQRPANMNGRCFYCRQPVGAEHKADCILIKKTVKIHMTIKYEVEVPASWDSEMVEFHRNDGAWCASNALEELEKLAKTQGCLCPMTQFKCLDDRGVAYLNEKEK